MTGSHLKGFDLRLSLGLLMHSVNSFFPACLLLWYLLLTILHVFLHSSPYETVGELSAWQTQSQLALERKMCSSFLDGP